MYDINICIVYDIFDIQVYIKAEMQDFLVTKFPYKCQV